jgi:hypothetical protein
MVDLEPLNVYSAKGCWNNEFSLLYFNQTFCITFSKSPQVPIKKSMIFSNLF